jgi:ATP-dependent Clp protease ATP-binding subunit ClpA
MLLPDVNVWSKHAAHPTHELRRVLLAACEEVERRAQSHVDVEHLFFGLVAQDCVASSALSRLAVTRELRDAFERLLPMRGSGWDGGRDLPGSSLVKRSFELAAAEAQKANRREVNSGDLLLALATVARDKPAKVLAEFGLTYERLRDAVFGCSPDG